MPTDLYVRRTTAPTEAELMRIIDVLHAALFDDKVVVCVTGLSSAAEREMYGSYVQSALRDGELWIAGLNNDIHAVALWIKPGKEEPSLTQADYLNLISEETRYWISNHFSPKYRELYVASYAAGPMIRTQSWHLRFIGVEPQYQRQGLGRALVESMIQEPSHSQYPMTTDVSLLSSVYFFQRFGFSHRGVKNFVSHRGGFPLWCLLREPSPRSRR